MSDEPITPQNASALTTLVLIAASGRTVRADGDKLFVSDRKTMPAGLVEAITRNKTELLQIVQWGMA